MDTVLKIVELMSKNWLVIIVLLITVPVAKMAVQAYVSVKIAKIQSPNKVLLMIKSNDGSEKTLEISTSEMSLKDLQNNILILEKSQKDLILIETKKEAS